MLLYFYVLQWKRRPFIYYHNIPTWICFARKKNITANKWFQIIKTCENKTMEPLFTQNKNTQLRCLNIFDTDDCLNFNTCQNMYIGCNCTVHITVYASDDNICLKKIITIELFVYHILSGSRNAPLSLLICLLEEFHIKIAHWYGPNVHAGWKMKLEIQLNRMTLGPSLVLNWNIR